MSERHGRTTGQVGDGDQISARDVLEAAPDALVVVNEAGEIVQLNRATADLFGYSREELLGKSIEILIPERYRAAHARHRSSYHQDLRRRPMGAGLDLFGVRKDGTEFPAEINLSPLSAAGGTLAVAAIRDISARQRLEAERTVVTRERALYAELSHASRHDALTGLPNRNLLHDRIEGAIASARRHGHRLAVLFLDLDRFKHVNDSLGHAIGDWLLESVGLRLTASVRSTDTVSRQGGDEFVILLSEARSVDDVAAAAAKMLAAVTGSHRVATHDLHVTATMGIAVYPEDGEDSETLIKNADIAMYHAKAQGRGGFQFFTREMNTRLLEGQAVETSLRSALDHGEFLLYYQPKVDLATGTMIGAEALLRWQHPDHGLLGPARFVPVAEDSGLIVPIGRWVVREACRQLRAWQAAGLEPVPVAVNISAIELRSTGFIDAVRRILHETGLDPRLLEIELTERVLMETTGATADVLQDLKAMGLRLAVDDFGTGYSSLSYLTQFPIDALKVDQSFVRQITNGRDGSPIVTAVISMGKSLRHRVIAEGVETGEQLAFLQAQACEEGQGFHFSRPLSADRFAELLLPARR